MHSSEERSVLSISQINLHSQPGAIMKLKNYQNAIKGLVKGRCALKPIRDTREDNGITDFELIAENSACSKGVRIDFCKKQAIKRKVNVKIVKNTSSMNKFPQDFFNSSACENSNEDKDVINQRFYLMKKHNDLESAINKIKNDSQLFKLEAKGK